MAVKQKYNNVNRRPFKEEYCAIAENKAAEGFSIPVIGIHCGGVCGDTIHEWMKRHQSFADSMKRGSARYLEQLEFMLACHTKGIETKSFDPKKANIAALLFQLKTKYHEWWSDKQRILELINKSGGNVSLNISASPIDLNNVIKDIKKKKKKA